MNYSHIKNSHIKYSKVGKILPTPNYDIETELMKIFTKELTASIDRSILEQMVCEQDWTRVTGVRQDKVCTTWLKDNIKSDFKSWALTWYFEDEKEAMMFALRWL